MGVGCRRRMGTQSFGRKLLLNREEFYRHTSAVDKTRCLLAFVQGLCVSSPEK